METGFAQTVNFLKTHPTEGECFMKNASKYTLCLALLGGVLTGTWSLDAQEIWTAAGGDANWTTDANWADATAPDNPYTGTLWFGDLGCNAPNRMDQSWNLRYLQYTNVSGYVQCFDDLAFPATADYATRTNRGWIASLCKIVDNAGAIPTNGQGFVRSPYVPTGLGRVRFAYRNVAGKTAPAATLQLQVSPDAVTWTGVANLTCPLVDSTVFNFATNLNDASSHYARVVCTSAEAKAYVDNFDVTFRVPAVQTVDLGGNRMVISNGWLRVGDNGSRNGQINHTRAALTTGILQIGATNGLSDLFVGQMNSMLDAGGERRGHQLAIGGTLDTRWLRDIQVGTVTYNNDSQWSEGLLDLSWATLRSGDEPDTLTADKLHVGTATWTGHGRGDLLLPPSLKNIEVGELQVGCDGAYYSELGSTGRVDFGQSPQLESLTVKRFLNLGSGAYCVLERWPRTVDVTVGEAAAPGKVWVGAGGSRWARVGGFGASLAVSNAAFAGTLSELYIGVGMDYTEGNSITGLLDLAHADVQIGPVPDAIHVPDLRIGGHKYIGNPSACSGTLLLPPSLETLVCGIFQLGAINYGTGILDFGENSLFSRFQSTNEFHYGYGGGRAYMPGLPSSNFVFEIGRSDHPASIMTVGVTQKKVNYAENTKEGQADLVLAGATFGAWVDELKVGVSAYEGTQNDGDAVGNLVLTNSTLTAFEVTGNATIGRASQIAKYRRATGRVRLPAGVMSIGGNLNLGDHTTTFRGLLDLHGTVVRVGGVCDIWETGRIETSLRGEPAGLDVLSSAADALSVSNGALVTLSFEQSPAARDQNYWGLRWAGEHVAALNDLCASNVVVCETSALPSKEAARVGVWYDARRDYSFVGIPAMPPGTTLLIR